MTGSLVDQVRARRVLRIAKAIRTAAGVSQGDVARELNVNRVTVARWEDGKRTPRGELLSAYVDLLNQLSNASAA